MNLGGDLKLLDFFKAYHLNRGYLFFAHLRVPECSPEFLKKAFLFLHLPFFARLFAREPIFLSDGNGCFPIPIPVQFVCQAHPWKACADNCKDFARDRSPILFFTTMTCRTHFVHSICFSLHFFFFFFFASFFFFFFIGMFFFFFFYFS